MKNGRTAETDKLLNPLHGQVGSGLRINSQLFHNLKIVMNTNQDMLVTFHLSIQDTVAAREPEALKRDDSATLPPVIIYLEMPFLSHYYWTNSQYNNKIS